MGNRSRAGLRHVRVALGSVVLVPLLLLGCARDLILDFGDGDSIRMVGAADNFKCDDPAYARVRKIVTAELVFADGSTQRLCRPDTSADAAR